MDGSNNYLNKKLHKMKAKTKESGRSFVVTFLEIKKKKSDSPAKPCHTMHSDAAARLISKLGVQQL